MEDICLINLALACSNVLIFIIFIEFSFSTMEDISGWTVIDIIGHSDIIKICTLFEALRRVKLIHQAIVS